MNDYQIIEYLQQYGLSNGTSLGHHSGTMDLIADRFVELLNKSDRQRIEIKRLNKKVEELSEVLSDSIKIKVKEIKSEAIKEFMDSLKAKAQNATTWTGIEPVVTISDIEDTAKEMVGDEVV